jgi:hypothetical protein
MSERVQQRKPLRAKRIKIGTIVEIPVKGGFAYAQYFHKAIFSGDYIRVFKGIFQNQLRDFVDLASQKEQFIISSTIKYDLGDELCKAVSWAPVPESLHQLPLFKVLWGPDYTIGSSPYYWKLKNVETGEMWKVSEETYDRQKVGEILPKEYHHLPSEGITSFECLVDRIELGWTHESDVFGPSYWEIFIKRAQERIEAEQTNTLPSKTISTIKHIDSPRPNPIEKPLIKLLTRMDSIMEKHEELGDTEVREQLHDAIWNAFIHANADYVLPEGFGMFTKTGNKRVRSALATFLPKATELALKGNLDSAELRLAAFQDIEAASENGSTYDDYFGDYPCPMNVHNLENNEL